MMVLMAQGIGPSDAVICPSFTFTATAEVVALVGATPVFADVEEASFNLDPESLQRACAVARKSGLCPRAVIPVDLFGQPADHDRIVTIAESENLFVLDDAARAFGATAENRRLGAVAPAGDKLLSGKAAHGRGDGGAVLTDDGGSRRCCTVCASTARARQMPLRAHWAQRQDGRSGGGSDRS
jgi:dTDP-4-amino-4,6-dideoxygalactose transaminase